MYFAGGLAATGVTDVIDILDGATGAVSSNALVVLSEPRAFVRTAVIGNRIFFIGGLAGVALLASRTIDVYNTGIFCIDADPCHFFFSILLLFFLFLLPLLLTMYIYIYLSIYLSSSALHFLYTHGGVIITKPLFVSAFFSSKTYFFSRCLF